MSKLRVGNVANIRYTKQSGTTERVIIPTTVPSNIKALDVSGLTEDQAEALAVAYQNYAQYLKEHMKRADTFEDFLDQHYIVLNDAELKWRTFIPENTEVL
jgi:hypothetical protein